jgi:hypothetical protein
VLSPLAPKNQKTHDEKDTGQITLTPLRLCDITY